MRVAPRSYGMAPSVVEEGQCLRKQAYITHRAAVGARKAGKPFREYRCPWCDFFHLTTSAVHAE